MKWLAGGNDFEVMVEWVGTVTRVQSWRQRIPNFRCA